jgi:transcriptional regulator with XRE-family HTH domain
MIRTIVAANVAKLRDSKYRAVPTLTGRNRRLAQEAGTTLSQIQRIINKELGTSVDLIESLADVLGVSPADMLTPYLKPETTIAPHIQHPRSVESSDELQRS